jgi:hypothetical protein
MDKSEAARLLANGHWQRRRIQGELADLTPLLVDASSAEYPAAAEKAKQLLELLPNPKKKRVTSR